MQYTVNLRDFSTQPKQTIRSSFAGRQKGGKEKKKPLLQVARISFTWIDMHFEHFQFNCVQGAILW